MSSRMRGLGLWMLKKVWDLSQRGELEKVKDRLRVLGRMFKAWRAGTWKELPWRSGVAIALALFYVADPIDLLPDLLPLIGLVDDLAVVSLVLRSIRSDMGRFLEWEGAEPQNLLNSPDGSG